MNILFLSYWGIDDGLSSATVLPHVEILAKFKNIESIVLVTIERNNIKNCAHLSKKITHVPLVSRKMFFNHLTKIIDFIVFPIIICKICKKSKVSVIIARGSPAGVLAMKVSKMIDLPFFVESFEPHVDYMVESGTWKPYDLRSIFQKKWEALLTKRAKGLMPVANNYCQYLIKKGIDEEKLALMPCCVDFEKFTFKSNPKSISLHNSLIKSKICGIYIGKFGDLYYDKEAFMIFKHAFDYFYGNFFLIILSGENKNSIKKKLIDVDFDLNSVYIDTALHDEVPCFLSLADFAFTLIKPKKSNLFCSPIKNGEYLALGLPIIMTSQVGDDAEIIEKENLGALFNNPNLKDELNECFKKIHNIIREENHKNRIRESALKYKSFSIIENVYHTWFSKL